MSDVCAVCNREPDAACRDYHCPTHGAQAAVAATGLPSLTDRVTPPQPDIRMVLEQLPHALPGGLIGNTVEQGPPYNLYEPRARIAAAVCKRLEHPPRVFEFGALLGYGLLSVAHRLGKRTEIGWCDNESHTPGSNGTCLENARSLGFHASMFCVEARESWSFGRADVVLVDGDHSRASTLDDLAYAYRLDPRLILIDDHIPEHAGVVEACRSIGDPMVRVPTVNGLVVVLRWFGHASPLKKFNLPQQHVEHLVELCGLEWEPVR